MSIIKYIDRLRYIDFLLRTKAAGNIKSLAKKLHLSRSSTLEYLREMKELGFPIKYCSKRKTYYYDEEGKMTDNLFNKSIDDNEMDKIKGGRKFFHFFSESKNNGLANNTFIK
ncbi:MAG TPA: hypothetical protein VIL78_09805 [Hanamia sp.]